MLSGCGRLWGRDGVQQSFPVIFQVVDMLALHLPPEKLFTPLVSVAPVPLPPGMPSPPKVEDIWALVGVEGLLPQKWAGLYWGFRRMSYASLDAHAGRGLAE